MAYCLDALPFNATTLCVNTIVVCAAPFGPSSECSNTTFYGCDTNSTSCQGPDVYADCTLVDSGVYTFSASLFSNQSSVCATTEPTVTLDRELTVVVTNVNLDVQHNTTHEYGSSEDSNVTAYGGSVTGIMQSLWAHNGTNVSNAIVSGPYFGGTNVEEMPILCGYLACNPPDANATSACKPSPHAVLPLGNCTGTYEDCIDTEFGQTLCVSETCEWLDNAADYNVTEELFHFPEESCHPLTVCEQITQDAIFPYDNTCLCLPGYTTESNGSCTIIELPDIVCGENQYQSQLTYECIGIRSCEHGVSIPSTTTTDAVCLPEPELCVGVVNTAGICISPNKRCTSVQYVHGSNADGTPECVNLSPPCTKHEIEVKPPTATTDRVCKPVASQNMIVDSIVILIPTAVYILASQFIKL